MTVRHVAHKLFARARHFDFIHFESTNAADTSPSRSNDHKPYHKKHQIMLVQFTLYWAWLAAKEKLQLSELDCFRRERRCLHHY